MARGALAVLTIGLVVAVGALAYGSAERADYGDAPDGRQAGYVQRGEFPSLFRSNGARARDTSYAHLGRDATTELDSLQVDNDRRDDGVFVRLVRCEQSEARIVVTLPTAGQPNRGTAFLNLFFDWNRDGRWRGVDRRCGRAPPPEWAVRNVRINLSAQDAREEVYRVRFRAGSFVGSMWFRAVLSVGQPMRDERGRGAFARGEVEDYIYADSPDAKLTCFAPNIDHGKSGNVVISPVVPGLRIRSARLLLTQPSTPERIISGQAVVAANGTAATFTYRSLKVDARANPVPVDTFSALVRTNQDGALRGRRVDCNVLVQHEQKPEGPPPPPPDGGVARLGWYSGPMTGSGSVVDFEVARQGAGRVVRRLQFSSRFTCQKGVTSFHVHVDGTFPVKAGKPETFAGTSTAIETFPGGRLSGSFRVSGTFTDPKGSIANGSLQLTFPHPSLGACDTGSLSWQAPATPGPTHLHPPS